MVLYDEAGCWCATTLLSDALGGEVPSLTVRCIAQPVAAACVDSRRAVATAATRQSPVVADGWLVQRRRPAAAAALDVRCYQTAGRPAPLHGGGEDRSIEEERDLAQMQIGALIDTAGVGIATFQESSGWMPQRQAGGTDDAPASTALHSISRDIVLPESLPEYERLQQALRGAQRAEVRYAVRHPELGQRWLLTRVEPATLASGNRTTSVVTLDVTEQHQQHQRSEQLLHEMATILESSDRRHRLPARQRAGALQPPLRGDARPGRGRAGSSLHELFGRRAGAAHRADT
jgi:hypothetical protein